MPLTNIQIDVLRLLASQRNPESYIAGATPLNRAAARYSGDIDIFHDAESAVSSSALADVRVLKDAGYRVEWQRRLPLIHTVDVSRGEPRTRLEWVMDSDFRFFPVLPDDTFGYVLHPVDLAMNKVMAAAGRRELRDIVDLVTIHDAILPLGAVVWAAVEKSPGFTPEGLVQEIRRNSNYPLVEWNALRTDTPLDPKAIMPRVRSILGEAEAFVARMPTAKAGLLFLDDGKVVQPDPDRLHSYATHAGQRKGHWPSSPGIASAMLEHYAHKSS